MSTIYKVNLTWTSPLIEYAPSDAWHSAVTFQNDSTASFKFYGNGFKWFGAVNASTYSVRLDGQDITQSRRYDQSEGPANLACNETVPWGCIVLAEANNLNPNVQHVVQLNTSFGSNATDNSVNLLGIQTLYDTQLSSQSVVNTTYISANDSRLAYTGDWKDVQYNDTISRLSQTEGSTVTLSFRGYSILLRGTTDKSQSPFTVSLDGHSQDVPLPSSNENGGDDNCLFWYQAGLDQSVQHTVAVTNAASSGLIISEFSYAEILKPDDETNDPAQPSSSGLSQGAIAGIVIGALALLFILAATALVFKRLRQHRAVQVGQPRNSKGPSTTSTLLSLRPLLDAAQPHAIDLTSSSEHGLLPTPYQLSPVPSPPVHSTAQRKQPLPTTSSRSQSIPSDTNPSSSSHPLNDQSRRPSIPRIQVEDTTIPVTPVPTPTIPPATREHRKPPLNRPEEQQPRSPITPSSSMAGDTTQSSGTVQSHAPTTVEPTGGSTVSPEGDVVRSSTPPPAYEPGIEGSREGRRERRQLQRTISKAIEERFHVVHND